MTSTFKRTVRAPEHKIVFLRRQTRSHSLTPSYGMVIQTTQILRNDNYIICMRICNGSLPVDVLLDRDAVISGNTFYEPNLAVKTSK